jgi:t-SNARE complex subunit (syntaxin)
MFTYKKFIDKQSMEALQKEREVQDTKLDQMSQSLDRLSEMAKSISSELDTQAIMIKDIDEKMEETQTKMETATERIYKLLKRISSKSCDILLFLIVIFVIVLYFALR